MANPFNTADLYNRMYDFGNRVADGIYRRIPYQQKASTKYGAGNQYTKNPNAKTASQIKQARQIDKAVKTGKMIDKGLGIGSKAWKATAEFGAPIAGGTWDMYSGYQKIKDGNPLWGAGQMLYGAGELGMDALGLLGSAFTGGGAEAADIALSAAARKTMQTMYRNLLKQGVSKNVAKAMAMNSVKGELAKNTVRGAINNTGRALKSANQKFNSIPMNIGSTAFFEGGNALSNLFENNDGSNNGNGSKKIDVTQNEGGSDGSSGGTGGGSVYGGGSYGYTTGGSGSIGGLTPEQQNILQQIAQGNGNGGYGYDNDAMAMAQEYMYNQQMMEPYRRNLQNYIRDYNNRADLAYNQDKELALLSSLTGASGLNNMIGKNNALVNEANRLSLMKTSGEDLKSVGEGMQTLLGNMALARQTGLPLRAANADTKMSQLAVDKMIADSRNENRLAVEQYKGQIKMQLAQARARLENARRSGNRAQTNRALSEYLRVVKAANDYGITADDIYRNTGRRFVIPSNIGQPGEVRLDR